MRSVHEALAKHLSAQYRRAKCGIVGRQRRTVDIKGAPAKETLECPLACAAIACDFLEAPRATSTKLLLRVSESAEQLDRDSATCQGRS